MPYAFPPFVDSLMRVTGRSSAATSVSRAQKRLHPSPEMRLPSSHSSTPFREPLPQVSTQEPETQRLLAHWSLREQRKQMTFSQRALPHSWEYEHAALSARRQSLVHSALDAASQISPRLRVPLPQRLVHAPSRHSLLWHWFPVVHGTQELRMQSVLAHSVSRVQNWFSSR